jgi:hypothetical protein
MLEKGSQSCWTKTLQDSEKLDGITIPVGGRDLRCIRPPDPATRA